MDGVTVSSSSLHTTEIAVIISCSAFLIVIAVIVIVCCYIRQKRRGGCSSGTAQTTSPDSADIEAQDTTAIVSEPNKETSEVHQQTVPNDELNYANTAMDNKVRTPAGLETENPHVYTNVKRDPRNRMDGVQTAKHKPAAIPMVDRGSTLEDDDSVEYEYMPPGEQTDTQETVHEYFDPKEMPNTTGLKDFSDDDSDLEYNYAYNHPLQTPASPNLRGHHPRSPNMQETTLATGGTDEQDTIEHDYFDQTKVPNSVPQQSDDYDLEYEYAYNHLLQAPGSPHLRAHHPTSPYPLTKSGAEEQQVTVEHEYFSQDTRVHITGRKKSPMLPAKVRRFELTRTSDDGCNQNDDKYENVQPTSPVPNNLKYEYAYSHLPQVPSSPKPKPRSGNDQTKTKAVEGKCDEDDGNHPQSPVSDVSSYNYASDNQHQTGIPGSPKPGKPHPRSPNTFTYENSFLTHRKVMGQGPTNRGENGAFGLRNPPSPLLGHNKPVVSPRPKQGPK